MILQQWSVGPVAVTEAEVVHSSHGPCVEMKARVGEASFCLCVARGDDNYGDRIPKGRNAFRRHITNERKKI